MKRLNIIILILIALGAYGFVALSARADIYSWTDENGVNHFTNYAPPKHAKLLMKTPEIPYDEEADNQRRETDRLEAARHELAEREAFLQREQQAAERRIAEANARADEALWEADRILQEAEAAAENTYYGGSNGYAYGYYSYDRYDNRRGYRDRRHHRKRDRHYKEHRDDDRDDRRDYYDRRHHRKHGHYYKKDRYAYPHYRHFKYGYQPRLVYNFTGSQRKHHFRRHHGSSRLHRSSHRSRAAAFRGRHGRF